MTTLNTSTQLKPGINTAEKLLAYAISAFHKMYMTKEVNEIEGQLPAPVITMSVMKAADNSIRLVGRYSLPLSEDWTTDTTNQLWQLVQEVGTVSWPSQFAP